MRGRPLLVLALTLGAVSDVLAQQPDPNLGRNLAAACASCHGSTVTGGIPSLAGKDPAELLRIMQDFRSGKRQATVMQQLARGYTDEQVQAIAAYLATQKPGGTR
jgi:cytochrome c553